MGTLRKLNVKIDDVKVEGVKYKASHTYTVPPGMHKVVVVMDRMASAPFEVDLSEGETVNLVAKQNVGLWLMPLLGLFGWILFATKFKAYVIELKP